MLWRRPGVCLLVHTHDEGQVSLELLPPDADADAAGGGCSRGRWRTAELVGLPTAPAAPPAPGNTWDEVEKRLSEALRSLGHDTTFFPGRFILHLVSTGDPLRFVQCWSQDRGLVIEATGYLHQPDAADPARLTGNGWDASRSVWQRRFPDAMGEAAHAATGDRMLVEELRHLGVGLADLSYDGTMTGRGRGFHLELPDLGIPRVYRPAV